MLMALGPFRFHVSTFSYEELQRTVSARWEGQFVIGRTPIHHFMGPGETTVNLRSTFFPYALNGRGFAQLADMERVARQGTVMMLVSGSGRVFGKHFLREIRNRQDFMLQNGEPQRVEADIEILAYGGDEGSSGGLIRPFG